MQEIMFFVRFNFSEDATDSPAANGPFETVQAAKEYAAWSLIHQCDENVTATVFTMDVPEENTVPTIQEVEATLDRISVGEDVTETLQYEPSLEYGEVIPLR